MKRVQHEKCATGKRCNIKWVRYERVQYEKCAMWGKVRANKKWSETPSWKKCNVKKLQHVKSATGKDMQKKKGATWKDPTTKRRTTWKEFNTKKGPTWKECKKGTTWKDATRWRKVWRECTMNKIKDEKAAIWKKCAIWKNCNINIVQHGKGKTTWNSTKKNKTGKNCYIKYEYENNAIRKKVQHEKSARYKSVTRKEYTPKTVQLEKCATPRKCNMKMNIT